MSDDISTIVLDVGSGSIKAGFAGDDQPKAIFPSVVGRSKLNGGTGPYNKDTYVGAEAIEKKILLEDLEWPVQNGVIVNWDGLEKIFHHSFYNELRVAPEEHPILLTEAPLNTKYQREKLTQVIFETFSPPGFYLAIQGVLDTYASGRTTGIVLDIGEGVCQAVPIYEGYSMAHATRRLDIAGRDLTDYLMKLLTENSSNSFTTKNQRLDVENMKKLCYVASNFEEELAKIRTGNIEKTYNIPNESTVVTLGTEAIRCPEALFKPQLIGSPEPSIHHFIYDTIMACSVDVRKDFYGNIILAGGTTMFEGFKNRLQQEIQKLVSSSMKVTVVAAPERNFYAWLGGSILGSLSYMMNSFITKENYDETGPTIVHSKCF